MEDVATIKSGLVLRRKENENGRCYRLLSARYIDRHGEINGYEEFNGDEGINDYLTREDDIIIKAAWPNMALYIKKENEGLLVSSYFIILRCNKKFSIMPEYLNVFLNSDLFRSMVEHEYSGTTVKALKLSNLRSVKIPELSISRQLDVIKFSDMAKKEKQSYEVLLEKKDLYYRYSLYKMMGGEADEFANDRKHD